VGESVGLRVGAFPVGQVYLWRIAEPAADSQILNIGTGNMPVGTFQFSRKITPYAQVRLGYQKNWNPLEKSALFGTGEDLNFIDLYGREWSFVTVTDTAIDADYPAALRMPDGDVTETALQVQADAAGEAIRRFDSFGAALYEFKITLALDFIYPLGSAIQIFDARYGFEDGKLAQVIDIRWQPLRGVSELTVWVWG